MTTSLPTSCCARSGPFHVDVLNSVRRALMVVAVVLIAAGPTVAEEGNEDHQAGGHHEGAHHAFENEIALFIGLTDKEGHDSETTYAIEYSRSVAPRWSIGATFEYVGGDLRNTILVVPVMFKPAGGLTLLAGPGVEFHEERGQGDNHYAAKSSGGTDDEDATHFLFRLGAGYAFHVGERYSVFPSVNLDLVDGKEVLVCGMSFGVMF